MKLLAGSFPWILVAVVIVATAAFSFATGYKVAQWRGDAQKLQQAKDSAEQLSARIDQAVAASNEATQRAVASNQHNLDAMLALSEKLEAQADAFHKIQIDLKGMDVGHCTFTPASDVLYQRAYEAAFGGADNPDTAAAKARHGHAPAGQAAEALPHQPPVPK